MKISIIIVTFNAVQWIDKCFSNFLNLPSNMEVIVVDNCSKDETLNILRDRYPFVKIIENNINLGFGKANNIAMRYALDNNSDFVFLLNQDAYISTGDIQNLAKLQIINPQYYILSPVHYNGTATDYDKDFKHYVEKTTIFDDIKSGDAQKIYETGFVNAAAWLMSRQCLLEIGGFNPAFFHYSEDDNYISRLLYHKKKIGVSTVAKVCHDREFRQDSNVFHNKKAAYKRRLIMLMSRPQSVIVKYIFRLFFFYISEFNFKSTADIFKIIKYRKDSKKIAPNFL